MKGDVRLDSASFEPGSCRGTVALISGEAKNPAGWATTARDCDDYLACGPPRSSEGLGPPRATKTGNGLRCNGARIAASSHLTRACVEGPGRYPIAVAPPLRPVCSDHRAEPQRGSPAKKPHPEERRRQRARVEQSWRGLSPRQAPRWSDPAPDSECVRGPKLANAAPSGARRQARGTERVISPAHLPGALRGTPQRWVWRRPLAGSDQEEALSDLT